MGGGAVNGRVVAGKPRAEIAAGQCTGCEDSCAAVVGGRMCGDETHPQAHAPMEGQHHRGRGSHLILLGLDVGAPVKELVDEEELIIEGHPM